MSRRITVLPALGALSSDDLFIVIDDPAGSEPAKRLPTSVLDDRFLVEANNLSDLPNAGTARANLGVAIGSDVQAYQDNAHYILQTQVFS